MDHPQSLDEAVAQRLRALRGQRGWSLAYVADAAGLHRTSLGLVERGRRGLSIDAAARLAEAFDLSLSELVAQAESLMTQAEGQ